MYRELFAELRRRGMNPQSKDKVKQILESGPPSSERKTLWLEITGAGYELRENPAYYEKLLQAEEKSSYIGQIDKDLHRTYGDEPNSNIESLRNVLIAYAQRNPAVGYCQGMNLIVARLLSLSFSEEETFWMLCQIIEIYLPIDYFSLMIGVLVDQKVLGFLLRKRIPEVYEFLMEKDIDPSFFSIQWFVCIFAFSFEKEVAVRIWDLFFVKGTTIIFSVALSILHINQDRLVAIQEFENIIGFIENTCKRIRNPGMILNIALYDKNYTLEDSKLRELREYFRYEVEEELNRRVDTVLHDREIMRTVSHFCKNRDECQQMIRRTSSFFTFSSSVAMFIKDDYLDDDCVPKVFDTSQLRNVQDHLLIGMKNHVCSFEQKYSKKPDLEEFVSDNREVLKTNKKLSRSFDLLE